MPLESRRSQPPEAPDGARALGVGDLTALLKEQLEEAFPAVWVRGEVSNLRQQPSGHCYFTLKDERAQISAVLFRGDAARSGAVLRDGQQVLAFGGVTIYEARGNYQIIVRQVVDAGAGRLQAEFERLKRKLHSEGLFDPARKRALPTMPARIGFITSPTGAAAQDFCSILMRRGWRGHAVLIPARVQGAEAVADLRGALALVQTLEADLADSPVKGGGLRPWFDLLVIGRGGGSLEDLWCFNDEQLARDVAACRIPIISAVGHEIDFTLCDFAADVRAETPSAAAELISSGFVGALEKVDRLAATLVDEVDHQMQEARRKSQDLGARLLRQSPAARLEQWFQRADDLSQRLAAAGQGVLGRARTRLVGAGARLSGASPALRVAALSARVAAQHRRLEAASPEPRLKLLRERLAGLGARLESLGPESVLRRGFAIVEDATGAPVTKAVEFPASGGVIVRFSDGKVRVKREGRQAKGVVREGGAED